MWIFLPYCGYFYLIWKQNKLIKNGETFTEPEGEIVEQNIELPNAYLSILPLLVVVISLYILSKIGMAITPASILSLLCGNIAVVILNLKNLIFLQKLLMMEQMELLLQF